MGSQLYVPGPVQIFTGTGGAGAYQFLGWSEQETGTRFASRWEDVHSDVSGPMVPHDVQYMGEEAYVSVTLTRYVESVLTTMSARLPGLTPGAMASGQLGSLMLGENFAVKLLLFCPYSAKTVFSTTMVPGYVFSAGWLMDDFEVPLSVRVKKPRLVFRCVPVINVVTGTSQLFSTVMPSPLPSVA